MFTEVDRNAVVVVQDRLSGNLTCLSRLLANTSTRTRRAVAPCTYKVSKVVRRDLKQPDGAYPEELHVICLTSASELPFRFEWVLDQNQQLSEFKFGYNTRAVYD